MRLDRRKSRSERQRTGQAGAFDLEAGLGGDAAGKLEPRLQVAVAAILEGDDVHQRSSLMLPLTVTVTMETPPSIATGPPAARAAAISYGTGRGPPAVPM